MNCYTARALARYAPEFGDRVRSRGVLRGNCYCIEERGLGDLVHALLKPLVRGTRFEHCRGCQKRREALNKFGRKVAGSE